MTGQPLGRVCIKWDYEGFHFHEHSDFTGLDGSNSAELSWSLLHGRAKNAKCAIDNGTMPPIEMHETLDSVIDEELRERFKQLDEASVEDHVKRLLNGEDIRNGEDYR